MKIELRRRGPGRGLLRVDGRFDAPESVALAVQRNDGRYLGATQQWQTTPHWYPQFAVRPDGGALLLELGPDIVDGIIGVGGSPLRCLLRVDGIEDFGVLRIKGELIGSHAAASTETGEGALQHDPVDDAEFAGSDTADVPAVDHGSAPDTEKTAGGSASRSRAEVWVVWSVVALLLAAVGAAAYLGLLDHWLGPEQPPAEPPSATALAPVDGSAATPVPEVAAAPASEPELTGVPWARGILDRSPEPDVVYARAEEAEQRQDCAAALVLFNVAADADPRFAMALARRYDPETFVAGGCIEQADAPYAIIFFADAARAGDSAAQRRLGRLMTERESSGPTYEEGLGWLRKAEAAGDAEAGRTLRQLGQ